MIGRRLLGIVGLVTGLAACKDSPDPDRIRTPEEAAQGGQDGEVMNVEGTVHTLTFETEGDAADLFSARGDRWLLIRSTVPERITIDDLDSGNVVPAWGLGIHLPEATLDDGPLPQIGDRVRVRGTFRRIEWANVTVPVLEEATIELPDGTLALATAGQACTHDLDCHDRLICDRASGQCAAPPAGLVWGSDFRNLHGTCVTDADCPPAQVCELAYTVATEGEFAPPYYPERDAGKHLCVPASTDQAAACRRVVTTADLSGGRYVPGKEICVGGEVWLAIGAEDGDTHLQLTIPEPLPYPIADTAYWIFGSTTEIAPPYKDPTRPQGAIMDPDEGDHIVVVGSIRFDDTHGWWEMHPVKHIWMGAKGKGKGVADLKKRYPTHPGDVDLEEMEKGKPYNAPRK
jgi:hypothetical protein